MYYNYNPKIYGHYQKMNFLVNDRSYFRKGIYGFWYDGMGCWYIGLDRYRGLIRGFAYYSHSRGIFSPNEMSGWKWKILNRNRRSFTNANKLIELLWFHFVTN